MPTTSSSNRQNIEHCQRHQRIAKRATVRFVFSIWTRLLIKSVNVFARAHKHLAISRLTARFLYTCIIISVTMNVWQKAWCGGDDGARRYKSESQSSNAIVSKMSMGTGIRFNADKSNDASQSFSMSDCFFSCHHESWQRWKSHLTGEKKVAPKMIFNARAKF